jgi:hypothetical protein
MSFCNSFSNSSTAFLFFGLTLKQRFGLYLLFFFGLALKGLSLQIFFLCCALHRGLATGRCRHRHHLLRYPVGFLLVSVARRADRELGTDPLFLQSPRWTARSCR